MNRGRFNKPGNTEADGPWQANQHQEDTKNDHTHIQNTPIWREKGKEIDQECCCELYNHIARFQIVNQALRSKSLKSAKDQ